MRKLTRMGILLLAVSVSFVIKAANLEFYPNFNTISVYVRGSSAKSAKIKYRLKSKDKWLPAHDMVRITSPEGKTYGAADLAGAIFYLKPATSYDVKVKLSDGEELTGKVSTRDDSFPVSKKVMKVSDAKALQAAVDRAVPGDVIEVAPGRYNMTININKKLGTPKAYILIKSAVKGKAVLDSSDPNFAAGKGGWKSEGKGVYSKTLTPARRVHCIWWNKRRLLQFFTKAEFDKQAFIGNDKKEYPLKAQKPYYSGSCVYDNGKLYVKLPKNANPDTLGVQVPMLNYGIVLNESKYVIIDGFTVRHYGVGVKKESEMDSVGINIHRSGNCVIRNSTIYGVNTGIRYTDWPHECNNIGYDNNTIEYNEVYDNGPSGMSWDMYKQRAPDWECTSTQFQLGRGTVVRYNKIHGSFGGVKNGALGDGNCFSPKLAGDMDIHNNLFYDIIDDSIEPDGACSNTRIWNNEFYRVHHPISPCPNTVGPLWIIRNVAFHKEGGIVDYFSFVKLSRYWDKGYNGRSLIYHNTLFNSNNNPNGNNMVLCRCDDGKNMTFRNNIMMTYGPAGNQMIFQIFLKENYSFDYDLLYKHKVGPDPKNGFMPFVQYTVKGENGAKYASNIQQLREKLGYEKHGIEADPKFVGGDKPQTLKGFKLKEDSPAIDKALNIPNISAGWKGFAGAGPDIGAFEFGKKNNIGQ